MKYPYKTRIGGASVTVLVPHERIDRGRFCINKAERERSLSCSLGAICRSIRCIDAITPRCDLVLDGVEPFANLESLQTILDAIPDTHSVYINTALPVSPEQPEQMILDLVEHNMQKIACLNISRPIQGVWPSAEDLLLAKLPVRFRIDHTWNESYTHKQLISFLDRALSIPRASVLLRLDPSAVTSADLYSERHDLLLQELRNIAVYKGMDGCRIRCSYYFDHGGMQLIYRKALPETSVIETSRITDMTFEILYDLLITQDGTLLSGRSGDRLDVDAYKNAVFEPYDLKWIEQPKVKRAEALLSAYRLRPSYYV